MNGYGRDNYLLELLKRDNYEKFILNLKKNDNKHNKLKVALAFFMAISATKIAKLAENKRSMDYKREEISAVQDEYAVKFIDKSGTILDSDNVEVDPSSHDFYYLKLNDGELTGKYAITLCSYHNVGIITTVGDNPYQTASNIKNIIRVYGADGPIFCDISNVSSDQDYYNVAVFCANLEADGCYVGFYGSAEKLDSFRKKLSEVTTLDFYDYSVFVAGLSGKDELPQDYNYHVYEVDGELREIVDLNSIIMVNGLNRAVGFKNDYIYIVRSGDTLSGISLMFQVNLEQLLEYNGLTMDTIIYPGDRITVPNENQKVEVTDEINDEFTENSDQFVSSVHENVGFVIDVSDINGHLNWEEVAKLYQEGKIIGVVLRMAESYNVDTGKIEFYLDKEFEYNLSECNRLGIPYGMYCFSRGVNIYGEDGIASELKSICNYMDNNLNRQVNGRDLTFRPSLPVYIDAFEENAITQMNLLASGDSQDLEMAASIANYWCRVMTERGYYAGLYTNMRLFKESNLLSLLDREYVRELWLANYGNDVSLQLGEHTLSSDWHLAEEECSMYQVSCLGRCDAIADCEAFGEKYFDIDICDPELLERVESYYERRNIL